MRVLNSVEVNFDVDGVEWVGGRVAAVLLEGDAEAADEGVEACPGLAGRAGAAIGVGGRVAAAEVGAGGGVEFGLPEVVEVGEELDDILAAAAGEAQRRPAVAEVLPEVVPVAPLLGLVAAHQWRRPDRAELAGMPEVEAVGDRSVGGGGGGGTAAGQSGGGGGGDGG